jgi:hypothetical protein
VADEITTTDLHHDAELGDTLPGSVKQFTRQGVQYNVYSAASRLGHDARNEVCVARVEDVVGFDAVRLGYKVDLLWGADCAVDLVMMNVS